MRQPVLAVGLLCESLGFTASHEGLKLRGQRASGASGEDLSGGRRLGWHSPDGSGQRLMVLTAEPGTPSCERLHILTS